MDKPRKKYWFKRRRYGYGWIPVTWQGWTVLVAFLIVVVGGASVLTLIPQPDGWIWVYTLLSILSLAWLLVIAYKKGPAPKWRWGKNREDNPDEDF
jgi:MFS family permease